jgi:hypothetical protein
MKLRSKEIPMTIQTLTRPATICNFLVALPEPIQASSRDYGFDFDEEEIGRELIAPLPTDHSTRTLCDIDPDEFESRYLWFPS